MTTLDDVRNALGDAESLVADTSRAVPLACAILIANAITSAGVQLAKVIADVVTASVMLHEREADRRTERLIAASDRNAERLLDADLGDERQRSGGN
ncbi:MAG TPA: hypothetical protein VJU58_13760 [Microbacterium sp.]|nr:hypothetical protein [Microbacterium sp.]